MGSSDDRPPGPISPELVLVDPELARWARQQLSDVRVDDPVVSRVVGKSRLEDGNAASRAVREGIGASRSSVDPSGATERPVRVSFPSALRSWVVQAFVLGLVLVTFLSIQGQTPYSASTTPLEGPSAESREMSSASREDVSPALKTRVGPPPARRRSEEQHKRRGRAPVSRREAPRVFVWVRVPNAAYYEVQFFRGRTKVFEALPSQPRLVIPPHWLYRGSRFSLSKGQYRWYVRPAFGTRASGHYGSLIVRSLLVVK